MFTGPQKERTKELSAETFIGPSVKLEGTFAAEGDIVIEGILVGILNTRGDVRVGPQAVIEAQVTANNAFIAGKVKGNLTITSSLKLASTAVVNGDVKTASLAVEEGALLHGKIMMSKEKTNKPHQRKEEITARLEPDEVTASKK